LKRRRKSLRRKQLEFASDLGNDVFIAGGVLLPLVQKRHNSNEQAYRTAMVLGTSTLRAQG
jgi:hypothetical protein